MEKRVVCKVFILTVLLVFGLVKLSSAGPAWKEEQAKMFSRISVKPGDVVDQSNWEKVKDLLPPGVVEWVKRGEMTCKIGEMKYDMDFDSEWKEATAKNEGNYDLDEGLEIREKATGKIPTYIYGSPYPNIDFDKDTNAAIKLAHNITVQRSRVGNIRMACFIDWLHKTKGLERHVLLDYLTSYYYAVPGGPKNNPIGYQYLNTTQIREPSDLEGMVTLTKRFLDKRIDDYYAYVPAIRRVKRLSGSNRSDPFAGSDFTIDGEQGWMGKNTSMQWKLLEKKITLIPVQEKEVEQPVQCIKMPNGAWRVVSDGVFTTPEVAGAKGAPWVPVNVLWVPRTVYVLEAIPFDKYYTWGKIAFYVDPVVGFCWNIAYDKSMTYWKSLLNVMIIADWGDGPVKHRTFASSHLYSTMDERTQHGCSAVWTGKHRNHEFIMLYNDPTLTEKSFDENTMATKSR
ncbi:MAG: DUF1329 domain-containing protein [Anaerolineaceae bacterium]